MQPQGERANSTQNLPVDSNAGSFCCEATVPPYVNKLSGAIWLLCKTTLCNLSCIVIVNKQPSSLNIY